MAFFLITFKIFFKNLTKRLLFRRYLNSKTFIQSTPIFKHIFLFDFLIRRVLGSSSYQLYSTSNKCSAPKKDSILGEQVLISKFLQPTNKYLTARSTYILFYCDLTVLVINKIRYVTNFSITGPKIFFCQSLNLKNVGHLKEDSLKLLQAFIQTCFKLFLNIKHVAYQHILFMFHNLASEETLCLLEAIGRVPSLVTSGVILRNDQLYTLSVFSKFTKVKIIFRNTFLLLNISVAKIKVNLCKKFKNYLYQSTSINSLFLFLTKSRINSKVIQGVENLSLINCLVLKEGFENFLSIFKHMLKINPLDALSLPSLSLKIFCRFFYDIKKAPIAKCFIADPIYLFLKRSYKQGVAEVYKTHMTRGFHYDVNGLYPFAMKEFYYPVGLPTKLSDKEVKSFIFDDTFFGFLEVEVHCPTSICMPVLLTDGPSNKGSFAPVGTWVDVYFSEELKYAKTLGYTFKVLNGYRYAKGKLFTKFVTRLYNIRTKFPRHSILNGIIKDLMNTITGRFAMKTNTGNFTKLVTFAEFQELLSIVSNTSTLTTDATGEHILVHFTKKNSLGSSLVHIASAITSYGRILIHKYKSDSRNSIYYSDTDSIFCKYKLNTNTVSSLKLGFMKLSGKVQEAYFLAPLKYAYKYINKPIFFLGQKKNSEFFEEFKRLNFSKTLVVLPNIKMFLLFKQKLLQSSALDNRQKIFFKGECIGTKPYYLFRVPGTLPFFIKNFYKKVSSISLYIHKIFLKFF